MIEEVVDAVLEVGDIERPAALGDLDAELVLFVALEGSGVNAFSPRAENNRAARETVCTGAGWKKCP